MKPVCTHTKKQKTISKRHVFLMEKYVEDLRQDEKYVPDLLESIIQRKLIVKDELRQKLFKMTQVGSKIKKIRVCNFQGAFEAVILAHPQPLFAMFGREYVEKMSKKYEKIAFGTFLGRKETETAPSIVCFP